MNNIIHYINSRVVKVNETETFSDVDLYVSQSIYSSGSSINSGSLYRILIQSGSKLLSSLPYENSNIRVEYSTNIYPNTQNDISLIYNTFVSGTNPSSSYYFRISSGSNIIANIGLDIVENSSNIYIKSGSIYSINLYSGNSNLCNLQIYDSNNTLIFSDNQSISSSYSLNATGSSYFLITGSVLLYEPPL